MAGRAEEIIDLYESNAADWDRRRPPEPELERKWLDRLLALVPSGSAVLDIGCGSGQPIANYLIQHGHSVTGIDSSPSLIGLCQQRFPQHAWQVADMRFLDLGRLFNALIAWHSFFHLSPADQRGMFAVFGAHAAPGAALLFTSGPDHGEVVGPMWGGMYHGSLSPTEYRELMAVNGFDVVDHVVEDPDCGGATVWLARKAGAEDS